MKLIKILILLFVTSSLFAQTYNRDVFVIEDATTDIMIRKFITGSGKNLYLRVNTNTGLVDTIALANITANDSIYDANQGTWLFSGDTIQIISGGGGGLPCENLPDGYGVVIGSEDIEPCDPGLPSSCPYGSYDLVTHTGFAFYDFLNFIFAFSGSDYSSSMNLSDVQSIDGVKQNINTLAVPGGFEFAIQNDFNCSDCYVDTIKVKVEYDCNIINSGLLLGLRVNGSFVDLDGLGNYAVFPAGCNPGDVLEINYPWEGTGISTVEPILAWSDIDIDLDGFEVSFTGMSCPVGPLTIPYSNTLTTTTSNTPIETTAFALGGITPVNWASPNLDDLNSVDGTTYVLSDGTNYPPVSTAMTALGVDIDVNEGCGCTIDSIKAHIYPTSLTKVEDPGIPGDSISLLALMSWKGDVPASDAGVALNTYFSDNIGPFTPQWYELPLYPFPFHVDATPPCPPCLFGGSLDLSTVDTITVAFAVPSNMAYAELDAAYLEVFKTCPGEAPFVREYKLLTSDGLGGCDTTTLTLESGGGAGYWNLSNDTLSTDVDKVFIDSLFLPVETTPEFCNYSDGQQINTTGFTFTDFANQIGLGAFGDYSSFGDPNMLFPPDGTFGGITDGGNSEISFTTDLSCDCEVGTINISAPYNCISTGGGYAFGVLINGTPYDFGGGTFIVPFGGGGCPESGTAFWSIPWNNTLNSITPVVLWGGGVDLQIDGFDITFTGQNCSGGGLPPSYLSIDATGLVSVEPFTGGGDNWGTQVVESDATLTGDGTSGNPLSAVGDNWGTQVVQSDATLTGDGTSGNPLSVVGGDTINIYTIDGTINDPLRTVNIGDNLLAFNGQDSPTDNSQIGLNIINEAGTGLGSLLISSVANRLRSQRGPENIVRSFSAFATSANAIPFSASGLIMSYQNNTSGAQRTIEVEETGISFSHGGSTYYTFPNNRGNAGEVLTTNGLGTLSWQPGGAADATTASNGLNEVGNDVRLGGNLITPTTVTGDITNTLTFNAGLSNTGVSFNGTGTKVATFNGDIDVTGTIDPDGILFDDNGNYTDVASASTYFTGKGYNFNDVIWINPTNGRAYRGTIDLELTGGGGGTSFWDTTGGGGYLFPIDEDSIISPVISVGVPGAPTPPTPCPAPIILAPTDWDYLAQTALPDGSIGLDIANVQTEDCPGPGCTIVTSTNSELSVVFDMSGVAAGVCLPCQDSVEVYGEVYVRDWNGQHIIGLAVNNVYIPDSHPFGTIYNGTGLPAVPTTPLYSGPLSGIVDINVSLFQIPPTFIDVDAIKLNITFVDPDCGDGTPGFVYTLPLTDGNPGDVFVTDGNGQVTLQDYPTLYTGSGNLNGDQLGPVGYPLGAYTKVEGNNNQGIGFENLENFYFDITDNNGDALETTIGIAGQYDIFGDEWQQVSFITQSNTSQYSRIQKEMVIINDTIAREDVFDYPTLGFRAQCVDCFNEPGSSINVDWRDHITFGYWGPPDAGPQVTAVYRQYRFPNYNAPGVLTNDGGGNLTWEAPVDPAREVAFSAITTGEDALSITDVFGTTDPFPTTIPQVFVNGILAYVTEDTSGDCYFGSAPGVAVAFSALDGDENLYWNGTTAGVDLLATDRIIIHYQK